MRYFPRCSNKSESIEIYILLLHLILYEIIIEKREIISYSFASDSHIDIILFCETMFLI